MLGMPLRHTQDMELRQLTYFAKVAELRSVSRAAAALHLTQPSLSRQIQSLERELGCTLFHRTARGLAPTPQGRALRAQVDIVLAQVQRIPEVVSESANAREIVHIGVPQGLPHAWADPALQRVADGAAPLRLSLHEGTTEQQREQLQSGLLDLGLIHMDAPELHTRHVLTQRMGLAVPADSAAAGRTETGYGEMNGMTVMAHAAGELAMEQSELMAAADAEGASVTWIFRRFSAHSGLIARTAGVDGVLATRTSASLHLPSWAWIPLKPGLTGSELHTWVAWRADLSPLLAGVVDALAAPTEAEPASTAIRP